MHQKVNVMMPSAWMNDLLWMDACVCVCFIHNLDHARIDTYGWLTPWIMKLDHGRWFFFLGPTARPSFHRPISQKINLQNL